MRRPRRTPPAAVLALPLLAAVITGCSVRGTVVVHESTLDVDLVVTHSPSADPDLRESLPCGSLVEFDSVTAVRDTRSEVIWSCRYDGPARTFGGGILTREDGHHAFVLGPWTAYALDPNDPLTDLDVTVVFPGRVVAASGGSASGTTVRFTDPRSGFAALAEDGGVGQPTWPALAGGAAGGLGGAGVGFAVAWVLLGRRSRRHEEATPTPLPDAPDGPLGGTP